MDSAATFAARLRDLGLQQFAEALDQRGWGTFGRLAFAAGPPGAPSTDAALDERVVIPVLGSVDHIAAAQLRRLYYEAFMLAAADMRRRMDRSDDDPPRPLPTEEREARRQRLQRRLCGLDISGDLDPSPSLINLAFSMFEGNA